MRKLVFILGILYLLTAAGGGIFKVMHWSFGNELLVTTVPVGVTFGIALLYFLLFRVGRRLG